MSQGATTGRKGRYLQGAQYAGVLLVSVLVLAAIVLPAVVAGRHLGQQAVYTGYGLIALMTFLCAFNLRKRLPVLPLIRAYWWLVLHAAMGLVALGVFWVHVGGVWPNGPYEQVLAALFYLVSLSGIVGYALEKIIPKRLSLLGEEFIYERVSAELALMREQVESLVLKAAGETGADTLGRYYVESLAWYFEKPHFLHSHLWGGQRGRWWLRSQVKALQRYLGETERGYLEQILVIGLHKDRLDAHYALQSVLKLWLLVHVPLATGLMMLAFWHMFIVNVYAL